jgi:ABC-2 type transport system ATP-binding protein
MIELKQVSHWYGQVISLNDVSCVFPKGVTALLGPNGAGKSTMMKLITGQLRPTSGELTVLGERPFANPRVFKRLGYCPESESSYEDMSGRDFVSMCASLSGMPSGSIPARVNEVIEMVGMTEHSHRKIGGYSKGMRQRIKIAQGIVHDPDVFILDEPLNGLDPMARHEITALLQRLGTEGKCIVVSSHILYEVEQMTTHIQLLHKGRIRAQGEIYDIRGMIDTHPHRIAISSPNAREIAQKLIGLPYVLSASLDNVDAQAVEVETRSPNQFYSEFPAIALAAGYTIRRYGSPDNNLEAVFNYLTS